MDGTQFTVSMKTRILLTVKNNVYLIQPEKIISLCTNLYKELSPFTIGKTYHSFIKLNKNSMFTQLYNCKLSVDYNVL